MIELWYSEIMDFMYIKEPNSKRAWMYNPYTGWTRSRQDWNNKFPNSDMEFIGKL